MRQMTCFRLGLAMALTSACAATAFAQNTLVIEQRGDSNALTVNQSSASGSTVGGLEITSSRQSYTELRPVTVMTETLVPATDGGEDTVEYVPQTTLEPVTVSLDVLGFEGRNTALQQGVGNVADIRLEGYGGTALLLQDGLSPTGGRNEAAIVATGQSTAAVGQLGSNNVANLTVTDGRGAILQDGERNAATLDVQPGGNGLISQIGTNITSELAVPSGSSMSYVVQGNDITTTTAPSVVTTGGASVFITQTQNAGF